MLARAPAAFLVPYALVLLVIGMPLFCLELYVGQKHQVAATMAWAAFHPALGGIGAAGTAATFFVALYYNVIVAWALWFLGNSFGDPLAWAGAANSTTGAIDFWEVKTLRCRGEATTCSWLNVTDWASVEALSPSLFDTGGCVPPLVATLALGWFLIWLCVCKGIESLGKVAWFTAIFPYFVLAILLVRGLTLEGAWLGLRYYLEPRFDRLGDPKVWIAAASQIFYSTGVGWGTLVAFASYNEVSHNYVRDAWLVPVINCEHAARCYNPRHRRVLHQRTCSPARLFTCAPLHLRTHRWHVVPCGLGRLLRPWFHGHAAGRRCRGLAASGLRARLRRLPLCHRTDAWRSVLRVSLLCDGRVPRSRLAVCHGGDCAHVTQRRQNHAPSI